MAQTLLFIYFSALTVLISTPTEGSLSKLYTNERIPRPSCFPNRILADGVVHQRGCGDEPPYVKECGKCQRTSQCIDGKCWQGKCTNGSYSSLLRCGFGAECSKCESGPQCATKLCELSKCVFNTQASRIRCCGPPMDECEKCVKDWQCRQGSCWNSKCGDGSLASRQRCFRPECSDCTTREDCITFFCHNEKCVYLTPGSIAKCIQL